ncbi:hypothetical protein C8R46DRAFT_1252898, partial [Mycena filopes]
LAPDLARLARTSQSFLEPALNALWRHQETIVNLLKVMPLGLWAIEEDREAESGIRDFDVTLLRPAIPSDWHRFLFYAQRVRSFNLWEDCKTPEAYETLTRHFPQQSLFPRLEELEWYPVTSSYLVYVRLFLTPTLTCLDLKMESISDLGILATLALICPRLTTVRLGGTPDAAVPLISTFIRGLHHLESLSVRSLDQAAFFHIAQLPNLRHLSLMSLTSLRSIALTPDPHFPYFPALDTLTLTSVDDAPTLLAFLGRSLVELIIVGQGLPAPPTQAAATRFYTALAQHCAHSSLQELALQDGYDGTSTPNAAQLDIYSVGGDALQPLRVFRNLVVLKLSHSAGFHLDDALVENLASAWPRIEIVQLTSHSSCRLPPRVTLEGIYAFAKSCPNLEDLAIAFDAGFMPKIHINGKRRVVQLRLESIDVLHSPILNPRAVARFLGTIFPGLRTVTTSYTRYPRIEDRETVERHQMWMAVQDKLQ